MIEPNNLDAIIGAGLAYLAMDDIESARSWLERALNLSPNDPKVHRAFGIMYMRKRDLTSAAKEYEKAVQLSNPPDSDMIADWGIILMQAERFQEARVAFEKERTLRPQDPMPYLRLAFLEEKAGNIPAAKSFYLEAQKLDVDKRYQADIEASLMRLEKEPEK